jgi:hypothetical protein
LLGGKCGKEVKMRKRRTGSNRREYYGCMDLEVNYGLRHC